jgi:hypothetical protein
MMMTQEDVQLLVQAAAPVLRQLVIETVNQQLAPLRERLAVAETVRAWRYCGIWRGEHGAYEVGDCTTHDGGTWLALRATALRPGEGPDNGWQLIAKSGRDGRDGIGTSQFATLERRVAALEHQRPAKAA